MPKTLLPSLLFLFLFASPCKAQQLLTLSEYELAKEKQSEIDSIVGLYVMIEQLELYKGNQLLKSISEKYEHRYVFHFLEKPAEVFDLAYPGELGSTYLPSQIYKEEAFYYYLAAFAPGVAIESNLLVRKGKKLGVESDDLVLYTQFDLPEEIAMQKGAKEGERILKKITWVKSDLDEFYKTDFDMQEIMVEHLRSTFGDSSRTSADYSKIEATANDDFVIHFRNVLNTDEIWDYPGSKYFPAKIKEDRFQVISVNNEFPKTVTYYILFEKHQPQVYEVLFNTTNEGELVKLKAINPSKLYSKKAINLMNELDEKDGVVFWR